MITNNHFRGKAAVNALQIKAKVESRKVDAPPSLVTAYPVLERFVEATETSLKPGGQSGQDAPGGQGRLFD